MNKIIECVPNFSEGRDLEKLEKILDCFRGKEDVKLLDYSSDKDHNRSVVTVIGEPEALRDAVVAAIGKAVELIDMTKHQGQHPRMGCVDVVPFIPIRNTTIEDADRIAKETAALAAENFHAVRLLQQCHPHDPFRQNSGGTRTSGVVPLCSGRISFPQICQMVVDIQTGKFLEPGAGAPPPFRNVEKNLRIHRIFPALPDAAVETALHGLLRKT